MVTSTYSDRKCREMRRKIRSGHGQGHGASYVSWQRLSRRRLPKDSQPSVKPMPSLGLDRVGHFLSMNEWYVALFVLWLGVLDLREQFPLFPWPHPHPLFGRKDYAPAVVPQSEGLLKIADDLGIDHGVVVGTNLEYVANDDLMLTLPGRKRLPLAAMVSIKPDAAIKNGTLDPRDQERLLLHKTYAQRLDMPWLLLSAGDLLESLLLNLDGLERYAVVPDDRMAALSLRFPDLVEQQIEHGDELGHIRNSLCSRLTMTPEDFDWLLRHSIWLRRISLDPRTPWYFHQQVIRTDFAWVEAARKLLFAGAM
jgi:TnsA endonuclease N terminal